MNLVYKNDLKVGEMFNYGAFGKVYGAFLEGREYCYKEFRKQYPDDILENISKLTEYGDKEEFVFPKMLVLDETSKIVGYLTEYKKHTVQFEGVFEEVSKIEVKKEMLKIAKNVLLKLHEECKLIHGDLSIGNILYDVVSKKAYLIDFDSALRFGQDLGSTTSFQIYLKEYLKYFKYDYHFDIYGFNLMTLVALTDLHFTSVLSELAKGKDLVLNSNDMVRKLSRNLVLDGTNNKMNDKFIIDYL